MHTKKKEGKSCLKLLACSDTKEEECQMDFHSGGDSQRTAQQLADSLTAPITCLKLFHPHHCTTILQAFPSYISCSSSAFNFSSILK